MYSLSFIKKALKLLEKYDGKITKTAKELGIKVRTLTDWKQKKEESLCLYFHIRDIVVPNTLKSY